MTSIIFAHTGIRYASYVDYYALVSLSGFDSCHLAQVDFTQEDTVYITSPHTGEWEPHWNAWHRGAGAKPHEAITILWCLERPGKAGINAYRTGAKKILDKGWFDYIWLSDRYLVTYIEDDRCRFVPLGSHKKLGTLDKLPINYDVCHFSCDVHRRREILQGIMGMVAPRGTGYDRKESLRSSRWMLNIHQDDWSVIEPLRFALAAAYGLPILTETVEDAYPYNRIAPNHYCIQQPYHKLLEYVNMAIKKTSIHQELIDMGYRTHDLMTTEFGFRRVIEKAVMEIELGRPLDGTIIR